jgi:gamma-glutamylaminecyclotransferase
VNVILFVYGTLKKGHGRNVILAGQKFLREAKTTPNYALYDLGAFPAMVKDSKNGVSVEGELWEIDPDFVSYLDMVEGSPHFYKLEKIELNSGEIVHSYLFQQPLIMGHNRIGTCWN